MSVVAPPRFDRPSRELFEEHVRAAMPVIATGITDGWPAAAWDEAALAEQCGDDLVPVERYASAESRVGGWTTETMRLRDYLACMARGEDVYLSTVLINQHLPRLRAALPYPACVSPRRLRDNHGYFIFAGDRQRSETHYHPALQAVLINLYGRKKVGLYSPTQTDRLDPHPWYEVLGPERVPAFNWSRVLPQHERQFPATRALHGYQCVLEPGEMLLIPVHWWHWAESLGPSISVTLLFNRRWGDRISGRLALRSCCGGAQYSLRAWLRRAR